MAVLKELKKIGKEMNSSGEIISGEEGKQIRIYNLILSCQNDTDIQIHFKQSPNEDDYVAGGWFTARGGLVEQYAPEHYVAGGKGDPLYCTMTGGPVRIYVKYDKE